MKNLKRLLCLISCVVLLAGCLRIGEVHNQVGGESSEVGDDTQKEENEDAQAEENKGNALGGNLLGSEGQNLTSGEPVVQPDDTELL